jgi:hypothetical protein
MNQPEIVRVNGPISVQVRPHREVAPDPATITIYSVQLASGLVVTSPDKYPAEP